MGGSVVRETSRFFNKKFAMSDGKTRRSTDFRDFRRTVRMFERRNPSFDDFLTDFNKTNAMSNEQVRFPTICREFQ